MARAAENEQPTDKDGDSDTGERGQDGTAKMPAKISSRLRITDQVRAFFSDAAIEVGVGLIFFLLIIKTKRPMNRFFRTLSNSSSTRSSQLYS